MVVLPLRGDAIDMKCLEKMASFLFYAVIVDFSLECLDFIHRLYESEESIKILSQLVFNKLIISLLVMQVLLGMIAPLGIMVTIKTLHLNDELKRLLYFLSVLLIQLGIFSTRWNVVIGGQMFSKSLSGLTTYKMEIVGIEGLLTAIALLMVPFLVLTVLMKILPPWDTPAAGTVEPNVAS
jgi:hypothetical protein